MKLIPQTWTWNRTTVPIAWLANCSATAPAVWQAWLPDDDATQAHLVSLLSADERTRLKRLQQPADQLRFLAGRGLLRLLVGAQLNLPAERVEFRTGPFGKPFAVVPAGTPALHFNVAHSGKLVVIAFSSVHEVGVDVEEIREADDLELVARRIFSASEHRDWPRLKPTERLPAFYQAWTRHEARLKTLGLGISAARGAVGTAEIVCADLTAPAGYQGAVAWRDRPNRAANELAVGIVLAILSRLFG